MTPEKLLTLSLLFYFLPKLALFLPLAWVAALCWWSDRPTDADVRSALAQTESTPESNCESKPNSDNCWYQHLLGTNAAERLPNERL